jgi:hypothetical protein
MKQELVWGFVQVYNIFVSQSDMCEATHHLSDFPFTLILSGSCLAGLTLPAT